jgi:predicted phosphodiesterase
VVPLNELALLSEKLKKFDESATPDNCVSDLRKIQGLHPTKVISRNFYRVHGQYSDATWNQHFGTFHEFRRQAGLELTRNQHSLERKIAKHASLDVYRDFYESEVLPYHKKFDLNSGTPGRFKSILTGSDFHDEDAVPFVLGVFIDTAERLQPNVICLNGDIFDNPEFSRFNLDPRNFRIKERFQFVKERIFAPLRKKCPKTQIDLIIGNHEYRILKLLADKTPAVKVLLSDVMGLELKDVFGLDDYQINLVAKLDLAAFTNPDIKDELKENYEVYYGLYAATHIKDIALGISGTSGHTHRPETEVFSNILAGKCSWVNTGSIAKCNAEYIEKMDKAQNSFVIATIDTLKARVAQNHVMIPDDVALVEGKRYFRSNK